MHLKALVELLTAMYGKPVVLPDEALRWEVGRPGKAPANVCVTLETDTRKSSIWVFDPGAEDSVTHAHVNNQDELKAVLTSLKHRFPPNEAQDDIG